MNEQKLLTSVAGIVAKNKEIEKIKGENFNLFAILDRRTDEVKTHSAFIAELLDQKGSHNLGDTFLTLFIEMLREKIQDNDEKEEKIPTISELKNVEIHQERFIGKKINEEGGRLDIYLCNKHFDLCIENKIYAGEQEIQLRRYAKFLSLRRSSKKLLVYLTLYGEKSGDATLKRGKDYFTLSYRTDILNWMENCMKQAADLPILRESIKQYIILIKSLTNQATSKAMEKEIYQAIMKNINAAEKIAGEFDKAIYQTSEELKKLITERIATDLPESAEIKSVLKHQRFSEIWVKRKEGEFRIGISSFNAQGQENGSLFIGALDFNKENRGKINYKYTWWHADTITPIWNKTTLHQKLQKFAVGNQNDKNEIADEIIGIIKEFISSQDNYLARVEPA